MAVNSLLLVSICALQCVCGRIPEFTIDHIDSFGAEIKEAVSREGAFLLSGLSQTFSKSYKQLATELPKCSESDADSVDTLDDATIRMTYAKHSIDSAESVFLGRNSCPRHLSEHIAMLSDELDFVGKLVADKLSDASARATSTLTWHTDQGAFLLLVLPPGDQSFHYRDHQEAEMTLTVPDDGEMRVLVVMGNTLNSNFFRTNPPIRPLPHAVYMKGYAAEGNPRVILGRMFLLPSNMIDSYTGVTYDGWSKQVLVENPIADTKEIIAEKRRLETNCNSSTILCWMRCMENTCSSGQVPVCWNYTGQDICPNDGGMHPECRVNCQASEEKSIASIKTQSNFVLIDVAELSLGIKRTQL
ncbi:hypothetical protein FOL47_005799 [Perkinsus chesapeaki]|uniref:Uncharacterized protein n=1 Tax=Perkinsus chesapeaki TaxID=330153 RepID=A0A7J6MYV6_PERCH|nr:hypothetical protein FOL47_005799 [Perkinsus chesapeaki]